MRIDVVVKSAVIERVFLTKQAATVYGFDVRVVDEGAPRSDSIVIVEGAVDEALQLQSPYVLATFPDSPESIEHNRNLKRVHGDRFIDPYCLVWDGDAPRRGLRNTVDDLWQIVLHSVHDAVTPPRERRQTIPAKIWLVWMQGWQNAPLIARIGVCSYVRMNPRAQVHLVSDKTLARYITSSKHLQWCLDPSATLQNRSDRIRVCLLAEHGGVYADAATMCCGDIWRFIGENRIDDLWFPRITNDPVERLVSSWFMISPKQCPATIALRDAFMEETRRGKGVYYQFHVTHRQLVLGGRRDVAKAFTNSAFMDGHRGRIHSKLLHLTPAQYADSPVGGAWYRHFHPEACVVFKLRHRGLDSHWLDTAGSVMSLMLGHTFRGRGPNPSKIHTHPRVK